MNAGPQSKVGLSTNSALFSLTAATFVPTFVTPAPSTTGGFNSTSQAFVPQSSAQSAPQSYQ